jgi:PiT family inorganic phosphate transporter
MAFSAGASDVTSAVAPLVGNGALGIPGSLAVSATTFFVGLGWGRATRTTTIAGAASAAVGGQSPGSPTRAEAGSLAPEGEREGVPTVGNPTPPTEPEPDIPAIGDSARSDPTAAELFDPGTTGRVVMLWILTPTASAIGSVLVFSLLAAT